MSAIFAAALAMTTSVPAWAQGGGPATTAESPTVVSPEEEGPFELVRDDPSDDYADDEGGEDFDEADDAGFDAGEEEIEDTGRGWESGDRATRAATGSTSARRRVAISSEAFGGRVTGHGGSGTPGAPAPAADPAVGESAAPTETVLGVGARPPGDLALSAAIPVAAPGGEAIRGAGGPGAGGASVPLSLVAAAALFGVGALGSGGSVMVWSRETAATT